MENKIRIRTKFNPERIISEVQYPQYQSDFSNIVANTASRVLELQEKGIQEALAKLGYVKQEWISVKDRLPEKDIEVLAWDGSNKFLAHFGGLIWDSGYGWDMFVNVTVTHWMPLPAAPEDK